MTFVRLYAFCFLNERILKITCVFSLARLFNYKTINFVMTLT